MPTYTYRHPHPAVAVDVAIFTIIDDALKILLVERGVEPFADFWALPGGFVGIDEDLADAARRELEEETGVRGAYLEQVGAFGDPGRDPRERVISVVFYATLASQGVRVRGGSDARSAGWYAIDGLPTMAFDHSSIIEQAYQRLTSKLRSSTIALQFLPEEFTLSDLQMVHETVLGEAVDKRNFQKWAKSSAFIQATGKKQRGGQHRPAELYRAVGGEVPEPIDAITTRPRGKPTESAPADSATRAAYQKGFRAGAEHVHKLFVEAYRSTVEGR